MKPSLAGPSEKFHTTEAAAATASSIFCKGRNGYDDDYDRLRSTYRHSVYTDADSAYCAHPHRRSQSATLASGLFSLSFTKTSVGIRALQRTRFVLPSPKPLPPVSPSPSPSLPPSR
ncbi:hypothetical protein D9758_017901 [Tetrapyrgos nigripes]|uniref:Uncharacterized protein n=1 Tax=Tetrapyrgos nigripes TaxID=182062 RepID=A0A8H5C0W3_9AGAR|nr:hypothetical protein D9758_017901 [Tetrapyrgos nigripes]